MKKKIIKSIVTALAYVAVVYPLWIHFSNIRWNLESNLFFNIFPALGLAAFTILWLHVISGVFEPWLRRYINFDQYVQNTSSLVFVLIVLHPLLLFAGLDFSFSKLFTYGDPKYVRLGVVGWLLLITYDIGKYLRKYYFFGRNWNNILLISTIGILLIFFHSLALGSDLQSGTLRTVWIFYGITAISATIYTYGIKRFLRQA